MPRSIILLDSTVIDSAWRAAELPSVVVSPGGAIRFLRNDSTESYFPPLNGETLALRVPIKSARWSGHAKAIAVYRDSLVGYLGVDGRSVAVVDISTGRTLWSALLLGEAFGLQLSPDGVYVASIDQDSAFIRRVVQANTRVVGEIRLPASYEKHATLGSVVSNYLFHVDRQAVMWMFPGDARMFFSYPSLTEGRLYIPPLRRMGTVALEEADSSTIVTKALRGKISLPQFFGVLSDSTALILYRDSTAVPKDGAAWIYYGVVAHTRRSQVCLDVTLPQLTARSASFALHSDTLEVLAGPVMNSPSSTLTRLRYRIDVKACTWLGVQPGM